MKSQNVRKSFVHTAREQFAFGDVPDAAPRAMQTFAVDRFGQPVEIKHHQPRTQSNPLGTTPAPAFIRQPSAAPLSPSVKAAFDMCWSFVVSMKSYLAAPPQGSIPATAFDELQQQRRKKAESAAAASKRESYAMLVRRSLEPGVPIRPIEAKSNTPPTLLSRLFHFIILFM